MPFLLIFLCRARLFGLVATCARRMPQDVLDNIDKLEGVERLVVAHVSERHGSHRNVLRLLAAALPPTVSNKVNGQNRGDAGGGGGQGEKVLTISAIASLCNRVDQVGFSPTWQTFEAGCTASTRLLPFSSDTGRRFLSSGDRFPSFRSCQPSGVVGCFHLNYHAERQNNEALCACIVFGATLLFRLLSSFWQTTTTCTALRQQ